MADSSTGNKVYDETVTTVSYYLGPAGKRYIDRQVKFHLQKKPIEIDKADLKKLLEWIKVSLALLTEDQTMVDEAVGKLKKISA